MKCPNCRFENPDDTHYCGQCGARLAGTRRESASPTETLVPPKKELTTGSTFAVRYQVIEELGKGGMGRVYKVFDRDIEEKVALKLLMPEIASDEETIKRFRNEIRVARKIIHKNVCRMYDLGQAEGTHFITMEYVEGENLKSLIRRIGQLPIAKSLSIIKQVGEGLRDKALEYFEKAYEERAGYVCIINADLRLQRLHTNPRFIALLKKMNL